MWRIIHHASSGHCDRVYNRTLSDTAFTPRVMRQCNTDLPQTSRSLPPPTVSTLEYIAVIRSLLSARFSSRGVSPRPRFFDDDDAFVSLWNQAREAALYPSAVWDDSAPQANDQAVATAAAAGPSKSAHLARTLGIGGHGPLVYDRLSFLVEKAKATNPTLSENTPGPVPAPHSESGPVLHSEQGSRSGPVCGSGVAVAPPEIVPSVFWGDVGAGYRVASARTIDFCRDCGVQAFSLRYDGGEGGEAALKRAEGAADFEFENVSTFLGEPVCGLQLCEGRLSCSCWDRVSLVDYFFELRNRLGVMV